MKRELYKRKVDTREELLARILGAAARVKKREDRLKTKNTLSSHTSCKVRRGGRCDFQDVSVNCNKFVI
jgi:hypothetical protein